MMALFGDGRKKPKHPLEIVEWDQLHGIINGYPISTGEDAWSCTLASNAKYCVRDLRFAIDSKTNGGGGVNNPTVWIMVVPIKIYVFSGARVCIASPRRWPYRVVE